MRHSPSLLAAMLAAFLLAGCTEEIVTTPETSAYRQTTPSSDSSYSDPQTTGQGIYNPYTGGATQSFEATSSASPGAGVQAAVTASQPRGLFKKTLELTVQVSNKDTVARSGYLVITFTDSAGKTELAYRHVTVAPGGLETLSITSTNPAASGTVVFKERFL